MVRKLEQKTAEEKSYYSSFRDTVYDLPWKKIGAYTLIAGVILFPLVAIALAPQNTEHQCQEGNCLNKRSVVPLASDVVTPFALNHFACGILQESRTFPSWYKDNTVFESTVLTGIDLEKDSQIVKTTEVVTETFDDISSRQEATIVILRDIMSMNPSEKESVISSIFNSFVERGTLLTLGQRQFVLGIHPRYPDNQRAALDLVEKDFLSVDCKIQTASDMEGFITSLHQTLTKGLLTSEGAPIIGGQYRTGPVLLQSDNVGIELDALIEVVRGKDPSAIAAFRKVYKKVFSSSDQEQTLVDLTPKEKEVLSLAFDFNFAPSKEIPQLMKEFAREYLQKIRARIPVLELAAWAHEKLIYIHPWKDANGRVARTLVNAELIRGGYPPFLIFNDAKYNHAIRNRAFKEYLLEALAYVRELLKKFLAETPMKRALIKF